MKKPRDFSKVKCYNRNEYGYYASHFHKRDRRYQRQDETNLIEEDLVPTLLMASTSFNKTHKKSSKDAPPNESIWSVKDYDDEDSKFGEIILEEDEGGHDQKYETKGDYDKLSMEDQQIEEKDVYNKGRKPKDLALPVHPMVEVSNHDEKDDQDSCSSKTIDDLEEKEKRGTNRSDSNSLDVYHDNSGGSRKKLKLTTKQ
nr:homeobox-leucine zipper protein HAT22-like [Tanacetum cinerariifolium]